MTARTGRLIGGAIVVVALLVVLVGFLGWASVTLADGGSSALTGWGTISGPDAAAGENINDVIAGLLGTGSYRPALLPTVLAAGVVPVGLWVAVRRSRFAAAAGTALGLFIGAWGLFRALRPGDIAGLLTAGDVATASVGPWVTLIGGAAIMGLSGAVLLSGSPPVPIDRRSRGIQPRR